ncbi:hypothetical protein [Pseudoclavibacter sp. 13-3]|nr:hypothetical protein [Pseudoclavibacter sp. 13-3]MCD7100578.1 hypothetical protein [Pseudoclavibacter sp. 13-3]
MLKTPRGRIITSALLSLALLSSGAPAVAADGGQPTLEPKLSVTDFTETGITVTSQGVNSFFLTDESDHSSDRSIRGYVFFDPDMVSETTIPVNDVIDMFANKLGTDHGRIRIEGYAFSTDLDERGQGPLATAEVDIPEPGSTDSTVSFVSKDISDSSVLRVGDDVEYVQYALTHDGHVYSDTLPVAHDDTWGDPNITTRSVSIDSPFHSGFIDLESGDPVSVTGYTKDWKKTATETAVVNTDAADSNAVTITDGGRKGKVNAGGVHNVSVMFNGSKADMPDPRLWHVGLRFTTDADGNWDMAHPDYVEATTPPGVDGDIFTTDEWKAKLQTLFSTPGTHAYVDAWDTEPVESGKGWSNWGHNMREYVVADSGTVTTHAMSRGRVTVNGEVPHGDERFANRYRNVQLPVLSDSGSEDTDTPTTPVDPDTPATPTDPAAPGADNQTDDDSSATQAPGEVQSETPDSENVVVHDDPAATSGLLARTGGSSATIWIGAAALALVIAGVVIMTVARRKAHLPAHR